MTKEEFERWRRRNRGDFKALIELARDTDNEWATEDIVDEDYVVKYVKKLADLDYLLIKPFLSGIKEIDFYYKLNDRAHARNLTLSDWDEHADELEDTIFLKDKYNISDSVYLWKYHK